MLGVFQFTSRAKAGRRDARPTRASARPVGDRAGSIAAGLIAAALLAAPSGPVRAGATADRGVGEGTRQAGHAAETAAVTTPSFPRSPDEASLPSGTLEAAGSEARVSTSPEGPSNARPPGGRVPRAMRVLDDDPPLTRAAARLRVETMSPARWLEHYGPVTVERRE